MSKQSRVLQLLAHAEDCAQRRAFLLCEQFLTDTPRNPSHVSVWLENVKIKQQIVDLIND